MSFKKNFCKHCSPYDVWVTIRKGYKRIWDFQFKHTKIVHTHLHSPYEDFFLNISITRNKILIVILQKPVSIVSKMDFYTVKYILHPVHLQKIANCQLV